MAWQIARHPVAAVKVVEESPNLHTHQIVVFTYNGEMEDEYGNKRVDIWTCVPAPEEE
jgi:hypothetical protein